MAADPLSKAFAALSDPTRRELVVRLAEGDATLAELAAPHAMSTQAVWKHLRVLEDAGLVTRDESHRRAAHLDAEVLDLMAAFIERYRRRADARYRRLDDVLATMPDQPDQPDQPDVKDEPDPTPRRRPR